MASDSSLPSFYHSKVFRLAACMAALVGVLAGVCRWIEPPPQVTFLGCWTDHLRTPLIVDNLASGNDRSAITGANFFGSAGHHSGEVLSIEQLEEHLSTDDQATPRFIYLSAYATHDPAGNVVLMTEEFKPITGDDGLLLSDLLSKVSAIQAPVLLALDLDWGLANGMTGLLPNQLGKRVYQDLRKLNSNILCLVSSSPGETPTVVASEGRSTFGYFIETGLQGYADGYQASGITDGRVSARELSAYVASRVSEWTRKQGPTLQTPQLVASSDEDFLLTISRPVITAKHETGAAEEESTYPDWLAAAWQRRDLWLAGVEGEVIPRLVKRYEVELLDIERRWRFGWSPEELQTKWKANSRSLVKEVQESLLLVGPVKKVSLAQHSQDVLFDDAAESPNAPTQESASAPPSPGELVDAWQAVFAADAKSLKTTLTKFRKSLEGTAYPLVATAALDALVVQRKPTGEELLIVQQELARISPEPGYAEVDALLQLAQRYRSHPEDEETLGDFLRVTQLRERAWADGRTVESVLALVTKADQQRQTAWAILLSPDYAPMEEAKRLNNAAEQAYRLAIEQQTTRHTAVAAQNQALRELPSLLPVIRTYPMLEDEWLHAAELTRRLVDGLERTTTSSKEWDQIESLAADLQRLLRTLGTPVSGGALAALVADLEAGHTERLAEVNALLATPLLAAESRSVLCLTALNAVDSLAEALQTIAIDQRPATIQQWFSKDLSSPVINAADDRARAIQESRYASALLKLAGVDVDSLEELVDKSGVSDSSPTELQSTLRETLSKAFSQLHEQPSLALADRCCRVLPAGRYSSVLDKRLQTPSLLLAQQQQARDSKLNAKRFRAVANDLMATVFAAETAASLDPAPAADSFEVATPTESLAFLNLSEEARTDSTEVLVLETANKVFEATHLQPNDCLDVATKWEVLPNDSRLHLTGKLKPEATHADLAATAGFLIRLTDGEQLRHLRIATPQLAGVCPVDLLVEYAGVRIPFSSQLRLPPSSQQAPLRMIAVNRTNHPRTFNFKVTAGKPYTGTIALLPLGEAAILLTANGPTAPAKAGPTVAAPTAIDKLSLAITDPETSAMVYQQTAEVSVADPAQYVRVNEARVGPNEGGQPTLTMQVERLPGSPDSITVSTSVSTDITTDWPLVQGGRLSAELSSESPLATLEAALAPPVGDQPQITANLTINGVTRAMAWTAELPPARRTNYLSIDRKPKISIQAPRLLASGQPLRYAIDAAPAEGGCTLEVALCRFSSLGEQTIEWRKHYEIARKSRVTVAPKLVEGSLVCQAALGDQTGKIDTTGITGRRTLVALVCDRNGKRLARAVAEIVIDSDPALAHFETPATPAVAGAPLKFDLHAEDPLSGVTHVKLFLGTAFDNQPTKGAKLVPAVANPAEPGTWLATLPMPAAVPITTVTAQVTNGVGLVRYVSTSVSLIDKRQASLGKVAGSVTEGMLPQPGLAVELRDADQKPIAKAKTGKQGTFLFDGVKPGQYLVWSTKQQSQRVGATAIEVKPGVTAKATVQLSL